MLQDSFSFNINASDVIVFLHIQKTGAPGHAWLSNSAAGLPDFVGPNCDQNEQNVKLVLRLNNVLCVLLVKYQKYTITPCEKFS
jgi:hypothetical protein